MLVNGVLASNYVGVQEGCGELEVLGVRTGLTVHGLAHGVESFHRAVCGVWWSASENEACTEGDLS